MKLKLVSLVITAVYAVQPETAKAATPKSKPVLSDKMAARIVDNETRIAYADSDDSIPASTAYKLRQLNWRASRWVSRDEAIAILNRRVPSYNEFNPQRLRCLPADSRVTIAREGSVCLFVKGNWPSALSLKKALRADEVSYNAATNETRLWWD